MTRICICHDAHLGGMVVGAVFFGDTGKLVDINGQNGKEKGCEQGQGQLKLCGWTGSDFDVCRAHKLQRFCLVT